MSKKLALIHTAASVATFFQKLHMEVMPHVKLFNIVDESLLQDTLASKKLLPDTAWRLAGYIKIAEHGGANVVMITCSSVASVVEAIKPFVNIPVLRIDEPMADKAIETANRIGVIATLSTTLNPTCELIRFRASVQRKKVELKPVLCEGAFDAFISGEMEAHDKIVEEKIILLMKEVDVVLLAQASMARVADNISEEDKTVPILSSPRLGMEWAKAILEET